tara:strand:- start:231 stop:1043 length:813 start_codon:yes stop_codon:yes gene_type:complete
MGGPGSGRRGGARGADGRYVMEGAISITVAEATDNLELLEGQVKKLTQVLDNNSSALDENSQALDKNTQEKDDNNSSTGKGINEIDGYAVNLQIATSALNQTTGALMKMTSGLEAANIITAEQAQTYQRYIRILEIFTGAAELALAVTLLLNFAGITLTQAIGGASGAFSVLTASLVKAAAASYAFLAPWVPLILIVTAVITVLLILQFEFDIIGKAIGMMNAGLSQMVDSLSAVSGLITGLTSGISGFGDSIRDTPVVKGLLKAGGSVF